MDKQEVIGHIKSGLESGDITGKDILSVVPTNELKAFFREDDLAKNKLYKVFKAEFSDMYSRGRKSGITDTCESAVRYVKENYGDKAAARLVEHLNKIENDTKRD